MDRRRFLQTSLSASVAAVLPSRVLSRLARAADPKRILVLGGTSFLGPALVEAAVVAGHTVTLFNRGITHPELFPFLEKLRGLRSANASEENLATLRGRRWDAIVDVWPSDPVLAESAARQLGDQTAHYLYVSSIATYKASGFARPGLTEDGALNPWDDLTIRPYDRGKSESERRLHALVGGKLTVARPGAIKGLRDDTPDLYAWLRRAQSGGRHIGPGTGTDHVQHVDVKDVGRFLVLAIERPLLGTFNLTGDPMTFREYVERCRTIMHSNAEFVWLPREFLHEQGLDPAPFNNPTVPAYLGKFPGWHPEPERQGLYQVSGKKALDAGWTLRPFNETVLDYKWSFDSMGPDLHWTDELAPDVERQALERWATSAASRPT
jgi:2'-hydroxyisoflavone reductase